MTAVSALACAAWSAAPAELACASLKAGRPSCPRRRFAGRSAAAVLDVVGVLEMRWTPHVLLLYCFGSSCPCTCTYVHAAWQHSIATAQPAGFPRGAYV